MNDYATIIPQVIGEMYNQVGNLELDKNGIATKGEYDEMVDYAISLGLENVFIQELQSKDKGLPDFNLKEPFRFDNH